MELAGKRVLVMGLGRFGGGVGVTRFLVEQGAEVWVTDLADEAALAEPLRQLEGLPIETRLGRHEIPDFAKADVVVVNPAVNPANRYVSAARQAGATITSEIRLLLECLPTTRRRRIIGVTGTAGKSTVTAMLGHALHRLEPTGNVWVGGNLGGSLLPKLERIGGDDWVVLELSSFMLERLRDLAWSPPIAVVTNFAANHLDWHGSVEAYRRAKRVILEHQAPGDAAVLGPELSDWPVAEAVSRSVATSPLEGALRIPGEHNRWNAALALAAASHAGFDPAAAAAAIRDFPGLAHRLELVAECGGIRAFNDAKSTTPEAAIRALHSFDPGTAHLILGGYDKGSDLTGLAQRAADRAAGIYTIGETGPSIAASAARHRPDSGVHPCGDLSTAVQTAWPRLSPGQSLVLSPGCASWDQFVNFEARGDFFRARVRALASAAGSAIGGDASE